MTDVVDLAARPPDHLEPDEIAYLRALMQPRSTIPTPSATVIGDPGWVPSVAAGQVIESVWGNAVRDRLAHRFLTVADRDNAWPAPPTGAIAVTLDGDPPNVWLRANGRWQGIRGALAEVVTLTGPDTTYTSTGVRDMPGLVTTMAAVPYLTMVTVIAQLGSGFASTNTQSGFALQRVSDGSQLAGSNVHTESAGASWGYVPVVAAYAVAANANPNVKAVVNVTSLGQGSNIHVGGLLLAHRFFWG